jgi:hypothetical protein
MLCVIFDDRHGHRLIPRSADGPVAKRTVTPTTKITIRGKKLESYYEC